MVCRSFGYDYVWLKYWERDCNILEEAEDRLTLVRKELKEQDIFITFFFFFFRENQPTKRDFDVQYPSEKVKTASLGIFQSNYC